MSNIYVTSTAATGEGTLSAAFSNAAAGDSILFSDSLFPGEETSATCLSEGITIAGSQVPAPGLTVSGPDGKSVIVSGSSANRILTVEQNNVVTLEGLTFANAATTTAGGAIYCDSNRTMTLTNMTFRDNVINNNSDNYGGAAVYVNRGAVEVENSVFINNRVTGKARGGALCTTNRTYHIRGGRISGNEATAGGAIYIYNGTLTISGHTAGNGTVSHALFSENEAVSGAGGAILINNRATDSASIRDAVFLNNTASGNGGAVSATGSLTLSGVTFSGNAAVVNGGGALHNGGTADISGCTFVTSSDTVYNTGTVNFSGTNVLNATLRAGSNGVFNVADGSTLNFDNDAVINVAGLTIAGNATLTFSGNTAVIFDGSQDFTGISVTVDASDYVSSGTYTVASNFSGSDYALGAGAEGMSYSLGVSGTSLRLTALRTAAVVSDPAAAGDGTLAAAFSTAVSDGLSQIIFSDSLFGDEAESVTCLSPGITLADNTFNGGTVLGRSDKSVTLSGNGENRILSTGKNVTISFTDLTFADAVSTTSGGAIHNSAKAINFSGATFLNNRVESSDNSVGGGAVYVFVGTLTADDSLFAGNKAVDKARGGALRSYDTNRNIV